jgi:hypothetical protein
MALRERHEETKAAQIRRTYTTGLLARSWISKAVPGIRRNNVVK